MTMTAEQPKVEDDEEEVGTPLVTPKEKKSKKTPGSKKAKSASRRSTRSASKDMAEEPETPTRKSSRKASKDMAEEPETPTRKKSARKASKDMAEEEPATPTRRSKRSASKDMAEAPITPTRKASRSGSKDMAEESAKQTRRSNRSASKDMAEEEPPASKKKKSTEKKAKKSQKEEEPMEIEAKDTEMDSPDVTSPKRRKRRKSEDPDADASDEKPFNAPPEEPEEITKLPPTLNVKVHRMRHLKFQPKAVITMACTPHDPNACDYIAVSREGGAVELKSPDEKFRTLARVAGMQSKSVDVMAWVCDDKSDESMESKVSYSNDYQKSLTEIHSRRTLIGGSKDGTIFVVDFARGGFSAVNGSGGGGVFCLTSLSCEAGSFPSLVAAGCEDGSVRIYKLNRTNKKHRLDLVSTVPPAGAPILSLAWIREQGSDGVGMGGTVMYAGVADGTIRRYECKSAVALARSKGTIAETESEYGKQTWSSKMRMTVESYGRTTPTRVWALKALADGTVVSADSLGHVQFWDGKTGTLLQSFEQNDKKADILALAINESENQIYASGIDPRIICIERSSVGIGDAPPRWVMTHAQRPHSHDVKALVICNLQSKWGSKIARDPAAVICSGGVDTKICSCPTKNFKSCRPRIWFPWPTQPSISVARQCRVLLMRREDTLELHQLGPKEAASLPLVLNEEDRFIGSMDIQSSHNLACSDISQDGKYVVASTGSMLLLFEIEYLENDDGTIGFAPKQIPLDKSCKSPCLSVKFLSNDSIVCATNKGTLQLLNISPGEQSDSEEDMDTDDTNTEVSLVDTFEEINESGNSLFCVHSLVVSDDGQQFAAVRSGVGSGTTTVFAINGDKIHQYWAVSALEAPVSSVSFLPGSHKRLVVACCNFAVYVFDLKSRKLSEWSEKNGFPLTPSLPLELGRTFDYPLRIIPNPKNPEKFLMVSNRLISFPLCKNAKPARYHTFACQAWRSC